MPPKSAARGEYIETVYSPFSPSCTRSPFHPSQLRPALTLISGQRQSHLPPRPPPRHTTHRARWQICNSTRRRDPRRSRAPAATTLIFHYHSNDRPKRPQRRQIQTPQRRLHPPGPLRLRLPTLHPAPAIAPLRPGPPCPCTILFHAAEYPHAHWPPTAPLAANPNLLPAADRRLRSHRPTHARQRGHDR